VFRWLYTNYREDERATFNTADAQARRQMNLPPPASYQQGRPQQQQQPQYGQPQQYGQVSRQPQLVYGNQQA